MTPEQREQLPFVEPPQDDKHASKGESESPLVVVVTEDENDGKAPFGARRCEPYYTRPC